MLRMAATSTSDRDDEPRAWPAAWPELRRQRPAPPRRAVRDDLDPAGRRRRRRRARRRAVRLASAPATAPRSPTGERPQKGSLLGPAVLERRDRAVPRRASAPTTSVSTTRRLLDARRRPAGRREGRRLVPGPDGVRPARARRPQHPRRPAERGDAGDDEPQDQVPRGFRPFAPSVLREHVHEWFEIDADEESPYMLLVAPVARRQRVAESPDAARRLSSGLDLLKRPRARTFRRSPTSTTRRACRPSTPSRNPAVTTALLKRFDDADRLPGARQHQLQRPRRADRLHARGRLPLLPGDRHGRAGAGGLVLLKDEQPRAPRDRSRGLPEPSFELD